MPTARRRSLAIALALYAGIELALLWRFPVFFDEALFAAESQTLADNVTRANAFLAVADNHGVLQRWLADLGIWAGLESLTAIRLVSIASGMVTVAAVAALARRVDERAAPFAAVAAALMPALVVHSAVGIADPLAVAAIAVTAWLVVRIAEAPTRGAAAACSAAVFAAVLTKKTGLLAVALVPLGGVVVMRTWPSGRRPLRAWLAASAVAVAGGALAWCALRLLAPGRLREIGAFYGRKQYEPLSDALAHLPRHLGGALSDFGGVTAAYATLPLLVLAGYGLLRCVRARPDVAAVLGLWALAPFGLAVAAARFPYPRYILPVFPVLAVLAGVGLAGLWAWLGGLTDRRWLAPLMTIAAFVPALAFDARVVAHPDRARYPGQDDYQYVSGFAAGTAWPQLARALRERARERPERVVAVAWGGRGVGPIGLAAELGRPSLREGTVNAGYFDAQADRRVFRFVPYREAPDAPFVVAQDVNVDPVPAAVRRDYRPVAVVTRPHGGSAVALLERKRG